MGIFDNVDMQQLLPVALSAFAGASDPRSAGALGDSGWKAVQSYMQQQEMDRRKQEFMERQKQVDKEMSLRERQVKISEAEETRRQEGQLDEDIMSESVGPLLEEYEKTGNVPSASQAFSKYKELATSRGRKPDAATFMKYYNSAHTLMGDDGSALVRMNPKGGWDLYDRKTGQRWDFANRSIDPGKMKWLFDDANALDRAAEGLKNQAEEAPDEKSRKGLLNAASGFSNRATELRKGQEKIDYQALSHAEKNLTLRHGLEEKRMKQQFGEKDKMGFYPGGPANETEEQARERTRVIDEGYDNMYKRHSEEVLGLSVAKVNSPKGQREIVKKLKDKDELDAPYRVMGQDRILYEGLLRKFLPMNIPREQKIAMARVGVEQMRGVIGREAEELKKERKPVSVKPEREQGEEGPRPVSVPRAPGGRLMAGPGVGMAPPNATGHIPYKQWIEPTKQAEERRRLEYGIRRARMRKDEATARRLEEELAKLSE